jgi:hypothetical protein
MVARTFLGVIGILLLQTGCAMRVPVPSGGPPGTPRVGWVIMAGDRDNPDREFVCQSNPRTECVMAASRPDNQIFSAVHFYFHSATADTKYTGTIQIEFFEGATPHEVVSNVMVKGGGSPGNTSVSGIVTSKPGIHPMTIAIVAESGATQQIRERVPVAVK